MFDFVLTKFNNIFGNFDNTLCKKVDHIDVYSTTTYHQAHSRFPQYILHDLGHIWKCDIS